VTDLIQLEDFVKSSLHIFGHFGSAGGTIQLDCFLQGVYYGPAIGTTSHMLLDFGAKHLFELPIYVL
jgi:hypothetical protein